VLNGRSKGRPLLLESAMASSITVDEYLRTSYEYEQEYVRGELVERGLPNRTHSEIQALFCFLFSPYRKAHDLLVAPSIRLRLSDQLIRVPDVAIFAGRPDELPITPPLVTIEILSEDDRLTNMLEKFSQLKDWGVPHIWLVSPKQQALFTYNGSLKRTECFEIPEYGIRFEASQIFL
jgi:Uma2 family endonuclease